MATLSRYHIQTALKKHPPQGALKDLTGNLLQVVNDEGYARVEDIHTKLFPLAQLASANTMLNRLLSDLNKHFTQQNLPIEARITQNRKAGARNRQVWFEGEIQVPAPFTTLEYLALNNQPLLPLEGQVLYGQRQRILLVTFNKHESRAVTEVFGPPLNHLTGKCILQQLPSPAHLEVYHLISQQGNLRAQRTILQAMQDLGEPRLDAIIATGICFGINPKKQNIGDVLISSHIAEYELNRVEATGEQRRGSIPEAPARLVQAATVLKHQRNLGWPDIEVGLLLSGEKLIDHLAFRDQLKADYPTAIGGEMEGMGTLQAASAEGVPWLVVKAICDFADGQKNTSSKERDQKLAAGNAAQVVRELLEMLFQPPEKPSGLPVPEVKALDLQQLPEHALYPTFGQETTLHLEMGMDLVEAIKEAVKAVNVQERLQKWANADRAQPLFALLGEYGMGKTISVQHLARTLQKEAQQDPAKRIPLLFDLRHLTGLHLRVPTLQDVLKECMARGWDPRGDGEPYTPGMVEEWIAQGAVVIFDGLDEALVKMNGREGQAFTRNLLSLVTRHLNALREHRKTHPGAPDPRWIPRVLLTCRSHYFRDITAQKNHFGGEDRLHLQDEYQVMELLPLTSNQIQHYLQTLFADQMPEVMRTLGSIHNLSEFCQRPYTLNLLGTLLPELLTQKQQGTPIRVVHLYQRVVDRWLSRDAGKHHLRVEDKINLAGFIAHTMSTQGASFLSAQQLEDSFQIWRSASRVRQSRYPQDFVEQLEEDLRTSTFLVRHDLGGKTYGFRFAHTSLQEYFLAQHLLEALLEGQLEHWQIQTPSSETLNFLAELLADLSSAAAQKLRENARKLRANYLPRASELLFQLGLTLHANAMFPLPLQGMDLRGAQLKFQTIGVAGSPLNLRGIKLGGADLTETTWVEVSLDQADLVGANLSRTEWKECSLRFANLSNTNLTGAIFHHPRMGGVVLEGVEDHQLYFVEPENMPDDTPGMCLPMKPAGPRTPVLRNSNFESTGTLDWSANGHLLAHGDAEGVVTVLDARTLRILHRFHHPGTVHQVAFSPDSLWLASCCTSGVIRVHELNTRKVVYEHHTWTSSWHHLIWHPSGQGLYASDANGKLMFFPELSSARLSILKELFMGCHHLQVDPAGKVLLAGVGRAVQLLDAHTLETQHTWYTPEDGAWIEASPDFREVYVVGEKELYQCDLQTGEVLQEMPHGLKQIHVLKTSPSGEALLINDGSGFLQLRDPLTLEWQQTLLTFGHGLGAIQWSPDGQQLAAVYMNMLLVVDVCTDQVQAGLVGVRRGLEHVVWSPDSTWVVVGNKKSTSVLEGSSGRLLYQHLEGVSFMQPNLWSPDSELLILPLRGQPLCWLNCKTGETQCFQHVVLPDLPRLAWSPDGQLLACMGHDRRLLLLNRQGKVVEELDLSHQQDLRFMEWASSGTGLLLTSRQAVLHVKISPLHVEWNRTLHFVPKEMLILPDDEAVLVSGGQGGLQLLDLKSGQVLYSNLELRAHFMHLQEYGAVSVLRWGHPGLQLYSDGTLRELSGEETRWLDEKQERDRQQAALVEESQLKPRQWLADAPEAWRNSMLHSPDGSRLLLPAMDGFLHLHEVADDVLMYQRSVFVASNTHLCWDPFEDEVVFSSGSVSRHLQWEVHTTDGGVRVLPWEAFEPGL
ncbi:pentapeptide repeat-containing protein [Deinococcus roseus]|uniref:NACHT domain-containing protein n=1 Tax=Deinococcus roseus TaxID=392414 RepID=A0ABQ2DFH0_9DEIO|nr:pentapeptide repeat-containing protein [Deinococcus roseus]GGJ56133.1 hypothetical protein GCM10008938_47850 [Deinococcus roseus]